MTRAKNASQRRKVLGELNEIRKMIKWLRDTWDVQSTVYVRPENRPAGSNAYHRDRRPEEYPEEQAESWAHLYNSTDEMIKALTVLRKTAFDRYWEIKGVEADRSAGDA